jgi:hypothetical protein
MMGALQRGSHGWDIDRRFSTLDVKLLVKSLIVLGDMGMEDNGDCE